MDDVTDVVFRQLVSELCPPDVYMTEFVSTDGLQSAGREATMLRLRMAPGSSNNLIAQIWGNQPELYEKTAAELAAMDNVSFTPHVGSATTETRLDMGNLCIANLRAYLSGKPLLTPV